MCRTKSPRISSCPQRLQRFLDAERKAEIDGAREVLFGAVEAVHREQLLRPQHGQRLRELGADLVLTAVAAGGGHEHRPHPLPVAEHREQRIVLVVGMRRRLHERRDGLELADGEAQRRSVRMFTDRLDPQLRRKRHVGETNRNESEASERRVEVISFESKSRKRRLVLRAHSAEPVLCRDLKSRT